MAKALPTFSRAVVAALCMFTGEEAASQSYHVTGRWWGPYPWDGRATSTTDCETSIHAMMLRGSLDTTVVLHISNTDPNVHSTCAQASPRVMLIPPGLSAPGWDTLGQAHCPAPAGEPNLFCCGHASLPDGRVLFVGGTSVGTNGHKGVQLFDPRLYSNPSVTSGGLLYQYGWAVLDSMKRERWYPAITPLPDGRMLVSSGLHHYEMVSFGGLTTSGSAVARRPDVLALTRHAAWTRYGSIGDTRYRTPPAERQDHTLVYSGAAKMHDNDGGGVVLMYGGRDPSGAILNEAWVGWRVGFDIGETWSWIQPKTDDWPNSFVGRYEHTAVAIPGGAFNSTDVYVYGGKKGSGSATATAELWRLRFQVVSGGDAGNDTILVSEITTATGTSPGARYGHTAVLDEYADGSTTKRRMLVFGGRDDSGGLADDAVYALDLSVDPPAWSTVTAATSGHPRARYRHSAVMDGPVAYLSDAKPRRMIVFGGEGSSGLDGTTHVLRRCNDDASCQSSFTWESSGTQTDAPSPRYQHTAIYDVEWNRMLVFGGDSTGSGGVSRTLFALPLDHNTSSPYGTPLAWSPVPADSVDSDIEPRARHASVYHARYIAERLAEVFDPAASAGQRWQDMSNAPLFDQYTYPFYFLLPSGNLLYAGRNTRTPFSMPANEGKSLNNAGTRLLRRPTSDPDDWRWSAGDSAYASFTGGSSAVMFEPGKVMKMGQPIGNPTQAHSTVARIEFDSGDVPSVSAGWVQEAVATFETDWPQPRIEQNLTMLPDGRVLVSGGRSKHEDDGDAFLRPQIWSPGSGTWSSRTELGEDPSSRGYHSIALLTPDARLLSAGGSRLNNPKREKLLDSLGVFTVFDPPYLYDTDGTTLLTRPPVGTPGRPDTVKAGQVFTVCTDSAATIAKVALLKPGATTHAFNMDQRYVPLSYTKVTGAKPRLFVTAPASINHAPPGDYLLYLTGTSGAPSVGRWLYVGTAAGLDRCDDTRPGKVTALNACHDFETNTVNFEWVSPPEDSAVTGSGPGTAFSLRYSTSSISNDTAWSNATEVSLGFAPGTEGGTHTKQLTLADGTYYFRLRTRDDNGNWSAMSTQSTVEVPADPPTECFEGGGGGGGGGGSSAGRANGTLSMLPGGGTPLSLPNANTLFPRPLRQGVTRDLSRLGFDPSEGGGEAAVWVSSNPGVSMQVDELRLLAVDHAEGHEALVSEAGIVTGVVGPADGVTLGDSLAAPADATFTLETGESATIDLGTATTLLLEAARAGEAARGQRNGVLVQVPQGEGWSTLRRVVPRRVAEPVAVAAGVSRVRLLALEDVRIERLGALTQVSAASPASLAMTSATGAAGADVAALLSAEDGESAAIANGQAVSAAFTVPEAAVGLTRSWFLSAAASFEGSAYGAFSRRGPEGAGAPVRFALHQNQPNPFTRSTAIAFDLPRGESVSLDVYDAAGRRVRTLASGWRPAGGHRVEWDQRDRNGALVRAGVYLYRLRGAASGVIERKLVVLP